MRKYVQLVVVLTVFFVVVLVRTLREPPAQTILSAGPAAAIIAEACPCPTATPPPSPTPATTPDPVPSNPEPVPTPIVATVIEVKPPRWPRLFEGSVFKDGSFTAESKRTTYGGLKLMLVMSGGQIQNVVILEAPNRTPTSERMSAGILPGLVSEAIMKQDWDVDTVSGATQTSVAFQRAMVYALRAAEKG